MSQEQSGEISCLDSEQIRALVLGEIPPGRITQFEKHLASCGLCRERLEKESGDPSWMEKVRASLTQPIDANEENNASPASATPPDPVLSLLDSSTHPDSLGKIKDYEILGVLGRGGMGSVLRAFDPGLNRFVALKILSPHLAANATARKRFLREARAAAAIAHENVIAIHGVSEFKGIPYLVMPLIRGDSLQKGER
jgi:serine/threonine-protein kinase